MAIITINIEVEGKEPLKLRLTDSVPLSAILLELKKQVGDRLPDLPSFYIKLSPDKTLAESGIKENDTIVAVGEKIFLEIIPPDKSGK